MTITYKNDESFFLGVFPPAVQHGHHIRTWFLKGGTSRYRFLRDVEFECMFANLQQTLDTYPGIRTITVVANPWGRVYSAFQSLQVIKANKEHKFELSNDLLNKITTDTFEQFVFNLKDIPEDPKLKFKLTSPLSLWTKCKDEDGNIKNTDYIIRVENLEQDFIPLQEYFITDIRAGPIELLEYREFYNSKTQKIVSKLFEEDIDQLKYKF